MVGNLENKVALITGAASGIGRSAALVFARQGAKVLVADISVDGGKETVQMIQDQVFSPNQKGGDENKHTSLPLLQV